MAQAVRFWTLLQQETWIEWVPVSDVGDVWGRNWQVEVFLCVFPSFNNKDKRKTGLTLLGLYFPNLLLLLLSRLLGAQAPSPLYHLPLVWEPPDQKPANSQLI